MYNKLQLLLSLRAPERREELIERLIIEAAAAQAQLPGSCRHRRAVRVPGDPTAAAPPGRANNQNQPGTRVRRFF